MYDTASKPFLAFRAKLRYVWNKLKDGEKCHFAIVVCLEMSLETNLH